MIYRDKANAVIVVPDWSTTILVPAVAVATDDQPGQDLLYFWLSLRNLTLQHKTSKYH